MTPPDFSVLLLAWDDADPGVAVLGGAALPPTQHLVYELAAQHPVLAVYPHLPTPEPAAAAAPEPGRKLRKTTAPEPAPKVPAAPPEPGILHLGRRTVPGAPGGAGPQSRIVGLLDLTAARSAQAQTILGPPTAPQAAASARASQWPPAPAQGLPRQWQVPAAPYAGASSGAALPPLAAGLPVEMMPAAPRPALVAPPARLRPTLHPLAGDLNFDPDPELPALHPLVFGEPTEEIGAAEARDLSAPEDDLLPDAPAHAVAASVAAPVPAASPAVPTVITPPLTGLNSRMIQYARQAAQLMRDRRDFGVIYAPNWPAWLAALEIRNSSGQPLVLYLAEQAADYAPPAERGWLLEVERMALRRATLILVPDEHLCRRLRAQYRGTIGEVRVVPAADEQQVQQVLREAAAG